MLRTYNAVPLSFVKFDQIFTLVLAFSSHACQWHPSCSGKSKERTDCLLASILLHMSLLHLSKLHILDARSLPSSAGERRGVGTVVWAHAVFSKGKGLGIVLLLVDCCNPLV